jgi:predicted RNA-binding Zn ribbon-like protein
MTTHLLSSGPVHEDLLVAIANTGHGTEEDPEAPDELREATSARAWWQSLSAAAVPARFGTAEDLALLRSARDVIRQLALRNNGVDVDLDAGTLVDLPLGLSLGDGPELMVIGRSSPARDVAAGAVLALIQLSGKPTASRFKACPGPDCGWVFWDTTRNRSRRWCDMAGCGNRAKAAAFRARGH